MSEGRSAVGDGRSAMSEGAALIVFGGERSAAAVAAQAALELAGGGGGVALLIELGGGLPPRRGWAAPAGRSAARQAELLTEQGFAAQARGALVVVDCRGEGCAVAAGRLIADAQPPVVVLCRQPRDDRIDRLLISAERVSLAASTDAVVAQLAASEIGELGTAVQLIEPPTGLRAFWALAGLRWPPLGSNGGQATVELLAVTPLLLAVALAAAQLLASGLCRELAAEAAGAGAAAILQDRSPQQAARQTMPGWSHSKLKVTRRGRQIEVSAAPPTLVPGLASLLAVTARADAGPPP